MSKNTKKYSKELTDEEIYSEELLTDEEKAIADEEYKKFLAICASQGKTVAEFCEEEYEKYQFKNMIVEDAWEEMNFSGEEIRGCEFTREYFRDYFVKQYLCDLSETDIKELEERVFYLDKFENINKTELTEEDFKRLIKS